MSLTDYLIIFIYVYRLANKQNWESQIRDRQLKDQVDKLFYWNGLWIIWKAYTHIQRHSFNEDKNILFTQLYKIN
jgi:hypothetical protein